MMSSPTKGTAYCGKSESMLPELDLKVEEEEEDEEEDLRP